MADEKGLTAKEERFCLEYCIDYNGTAAARRAGYAEKSAAKSACKLLKEERVLQRVRELQQEQAKRLCLSSDLVLIRTMELLDTCMAKKKPIREWDYEAHEWKETGEYQIDSKGAAKALEMLGKYLGMFDGEKGLQGDTGPVFYEGEGDVLA